MDVTGGPGDYSPQRDLRPTAHRAGRRRRRAAPRGRPGACEWGQFTVSVPTVVVDDGSLTSSPEKTADMKYVPLARPFSMELPVHVATLLKSGAPVKVVSNTAVPVAPAHPVTGVPAPFWVVERW